ncbi:MAG: alpha/beta hydrolase [Octadecabacter sp.]|nr:alpha/beta hydrolase [Octadecabacter sp.]
MRNSILLSCTIAFVGLAGCENVDYTAMSFRADGDRVVATGVNDEDTLSRFRIVSEDNPQAKILVLQNVGGSVEDEANLIFSQEVRAAGFTTVVPSDGMVASGGVDLFLAGSDRVLEPGACVGVHSWSGGGVEGKDVPRSDPEHQKILAIL